MGNVSTNVRAKFRCALLLIKILGIFRELINDNNQIKQIKYSFNKNFDKPQSSIQWSHISLHKKMITVFIQHTDDKTIVS